MHILAPNLIFILLPAVLSFLIGIALTPVLSDYLYYYKAWKKTPGKQALDGSVAHEFNRLHNGNETRAPRMGGIVVWGSVVLTVALLAIAQMLAPEDADRFQFLTRSQTWLPFGALIVGAIAGFLDDMLVIRPGGQGLRLRTRLLTVVALSLFVGYWFYVKLGVVAVGVPFGTPLVIGWLIVPLFVLISLAVYASGVIDGIDGLSGGVFASIFAAYAIIAAFQEQNDLAAFCMCVVGGLLAFLWFNIPPARFYMSDTGTMALTLALAVVAFMTDMPGEGIGISVLPVIGGILVATVASNIAQIVWKKMYGKKLLRIAPLHHHFEAIGWPPYKVVMRYWVISVVLASAGVILALSSHV